MFKQIGEFWETAGNWNRKTLDGIKGTLFMVLIVDIFGIVWYLKLKSLGISIMIVILMLLIFIFILERRIDDKMIDEEPTKIDKEEDKGKEKKKEDKKEEDKDEKESEGFDIELPDADEYQKRLDEAIGFN